MLISTVPADRFIRVGWGGITKHMCTAQGGEGKGFIGRESGVGQARDSSSGAKAREDGEVWWKGSERRTGDSVTQAQGVAGCRWGGRGWGRMRGPTARQGSKALRPASTENAILNHRIGRAGGGGGGGWPVAGGQAQLRTRALDTDTATTQKCTQSYTTSLPAWCTEP